MDDQEMTGSSKASPVSEGLHRIVLVVVLLFSVSCLFLTYIGIDTYIESGRSVYGDGRTAVRFQWKKESCNELFRGVLPSRVPPSLRRRTDEICEIARSRHLPPIALMPVIQEFRSAGSADPLTSEGNFERHRVLLEGVRVGLTRRLPELETEYGRHQREVSCMWLFFPGVIGAVFSYSYARRRTPLLFAVIKRRFENIMFGRNKYSDAFDNFTGRKRK
jgi:hypothetical protein